MIIKQKTYYSLIFLTLISFGFFGSLSHLFSIALIILTFVSREVSSQKIEINFDAKIVYFALSGVFFLFFITSVFRSNLWVVLQALSPMLPIPLIGILIIFHSRTNLRLSGKTIAQFSQLSIIFSFLVYLFLSNSSFQDSFYNSFNGDRLSLFSGNPIPFSYSMLGISIFCLANWINSSNKGKICAFVCFLTGAYFAGYLSGTRGTLLSIVVIMPVVTFYLTGNIRHCIILILILTLLSVLLVKIFTSIDFERLYLSRIINGFNTILFLNNDDSSISQRINMWYASLQAIFDAPVFGYGITERFNALKPFLHGSSIEYSHPHNDTLAASIASGILGGITALISLLSILLAGIMAPQRNFEKLLLSLMLSVPTLITANVSTIFFNDITSAWLAFSTYLIWVGDFTIDNFDRPNSTG